MPCTESAFAATSYFTRGEATYRHDLLLVGPLLVRAAAALRAEEQLVGIWGARSYELRSRGEAMGQVDAT